MCLSSYVSSILNHNPFAYVCKKEIPDSSKRDIYIFHSVASVWKRKYTSRDKMKLECNNRFYWITKKYVSKQEKKRNWINIYGNKFLWKEINKIIGTIEIGFSSMPTNIWCEYRLYWRFDDVEIYLFRYNHKIENQLKFMCCIWCCIAKKTYFRLLLLELRHTKNTQYQIKRLLFICFYRYTLFAFISFSVEKNSTKQFF